MQNTHTLVGGLGAKLEALQAIRSTALALQAVLEGTPGLYSTVLALQAAIDIVVK